MLLLLGPILFKSQDSLIQADFYNSSAISYLIIACLLMFLSFVEHRLHLQSIIQPTTDLLMLSLLAYAGPSTTAGFTILMALATIFGLLLIRNRFALFLGIGAVFSIVLINYLRNDNFSQNLYSDISLQILGILAVSLLGNSLARRLTHYEIEADINKRSIHSMHQLNRQIIDKMNRGVLVVNSDKVIMHINQTAWYGLGLPENPVGKPLKSIVDELNYQYDRIKSDNYEGQPFRATGTGPQLLPRFITLEDQNTKLILIDNYSEIIKKVQQVKLASLGQLTASIAHEIRNPLSAINQATQILSEHEQKTEQEQDLMTIIQRQSKRINGIIENIQKVSKRKPADKQPLLVDRFLESFIKEYKQGLKFNPEITCDEIAQELQVHFDHSQLKQVLSNLFDNALKFSFINTNSYRVHLTAGSDPMSGQTFLDVTDEGTGVSIEEIDKIFEPFYTTNHDGTGLGLYISKELCEANNARLDCVPIAFGGACFRISFNMENP